MRPALVVIDVQNDYFPGGSYPLWNSAAVLQNVEAAIAKATAKAIPVILVQHVADAGKGLAPFFNAGTPGVELHARVRAAAPTATVVQKQFADAFHETSLQSTLQALRVDGLLVCGMMTQNCVTHTAISKQAEAYDVTVLTDCCTTVDELLHKIALAALSTRVRLLPSAEAFVGR